MLVIIILLFSSKTFSPIPYFPSQPVDLPLIVKALNLRNNQTIIDLGAGDGIVIFKAATQAQKKKLNAKFIAVEINPVLILILHLRRLFHPNRKNIKIIHEDIFNINFKDFIDFTDLMTIYLYISPWFLEKTISSINQQLAIRNQQLTIVSYMYPIKSMKKVEKIIKGKNNIFVYS
ncbi:MAG: hypothetical protein UR63_C0004G0023 [Candidatus Roizmanbacteria bacterium GW2011_GWC2_35_12]|uniref:Methyltransferase domain-containing protein n=1 Tax=Candidatus Roizmanbacteria bacterium GW2011_GWC2_35_12 TaxID=1618485 RepID=A0A0G0DZ27_9BACT|nr:MAG: hypothetical protein UR63_C0004G0023 [Candidatus Roizmanbacteria bacterium GW2011_GWC2_35_12]